MLHEVLIEAGYEPFSYSGRGMFGATCLAVRVSHLGGFIADVFNSLSEDEDLSNIGDEFYSMKTDNLGLDTVVYFTNVPYKDSFDGDDQ